MAEPVVYPEGVLDFTDQQDAIWFQNSINPIATVVYNGREASVYCVGDVRVIIGDDEFRNLNDILDFGVSSDAQLFEAEERGDIEFLNNNWFELLDVQTDQFVDIICHSLHEAIDAAVDYVSG